MKESEYAKSVEFCTKVQILHKRMDDLKKMIGGIERRLGDGSKDLRMYVSSRCPRHGRYDAGVDVTLPEGMLTEAILPALKSQLERLKKEFAELQAPQEFRIKRGTKARSK